MCFGSTGGEFKDTGLKAAATKATKYAILKCKDVPAAAVNHVVDFTLQTGVREQIPWTAPRAPESQGKAETRGTPLGMTTWWWTAHIAWGATSRMKGKIPE